MLNHCPPTDLNCNQLIRLALFAWSNESNGLPDLKNEIELSEN